MQIKRGEGRERERLRQFEFISKKDVTPHVNSNHQRTTAQGKNVNYQPDVACLFVEVFLTFQH
jgi:hypothetical protein